MGGEERCLQGFNRATCGRHHFQDLAMDGMMLLMMIMIIIIIIIDLLRSVMGGMDWIDLAQDRGQVAGCCKCGNDSLGFLKCGEFLDLVSGRLYIHIFTHIVHNSSHRSRSGKKQNKHGVAKTKIPSTARCSS